jgi:hypothetical protein
MNGENALSRLAAVCLLLLLALSAAPLFAKEGTAHLTFEKGKAAQRDTFLYTIKKGDTLFALVTAVYRPESVVARRHIYGAVKKLNPRVTSIHVIYTGQRMRLPKPHLFSDGGTAPAVEIGGNKKIVEVASAPAASSLPPPLSRSDYRMAVVKEVLARMNGVLMTTGNYYIPLPQSGHITIDCERIPVAALADGSIILLDFSQRMSPPLRNMIRAHWPNHHPVTVRLDEESTVILQKLLQPSSSYSMTRTQAPLDIGKAPRLKLAPNWVISEISARGGQNTIQYISFLKERSSILPKAVAEYAQRGGLVITDVLRGHGVVDPPAMPRTTLSHADLKNFDKRDLCAGVMGVFNIPTSRNIDVKIFDEKQDGFNLSLSAELLARHGNRQALFTASPLPPQFSAILRERDVETVLLADGDSRRAVLEKMLAAIGVSFSSDVFSFPLPQSIDKPRGAVLFPAIRVAVGASVRYLIDFDMDQDIYSWLHQQWDIRLIRY